MEYKDVSCKREIYDGLVPKLSKRNKVGFPEKPQQLDLNRLEEFFIAPLSAFMTIRSLPVCGLVSTGQKLLIGSVVHVANDVGKTVSSLPRMLDDMDTVAVRIKRRKIYKTAVFTENVRPLKVVNALQYLIKNSEMYKPYNFQVPEKWLSHVENSTHDNRYFVEGKYPSASEEETMPMEDVAKTQFEEISSAEMTQGNMDTLLTENQPNITQSYDQRDSEDDFDISNKILTLAPGEGKIPVFGNPFAEYLAFPTKFCGQTRPLNSERFRHVHTSELFKAELKHVDKRVWDDSANIFWKAKHREIQRIRDKVTLVLRRVVGPKQQNITAERLLNKEQREDIRRQDDGYHIFKDIPNTPPYFEKLGRELRAMVRQLGNPTIFISLSAADTSWVPLQQALGHLLDEAIYSEDFIKEEMSFEKKCQQVSSHPAACSRYFHHRIQKFYKFIIMGPHSPFGNVLDYAYRTEFQKRGSPHIHGLLWVKDAPEFGISSDEEISKYIDSCMSCSLDVTEEEKPFVKLQIHKHSRTCKKIVKGKPTCRFGVPWLPMQETQILYPLGTDNADDISALQEQYKSLTYKLNKLPEDVQTHKSWLIYNDIDEDTYIKIIRSTLKRPKVFLKRKPPEYRVNAYMKGLLAVWQANHDVQYVLDPYQCVTYICDYMMKSQKGMSDLLRAASEEAKAGNMNIRECVRHIGNKFLNAAEEPIQACCYAILQLPIANSTRKKEFINTSPPEDRVGLTKSLYDLEQLPPTSKDVTYKSNIDRYMMRPKQLAAWCLADFVAKIDIVYPKKEKSSHSNTNGENLKHPDESNDDDDQNPSYNDEGYFPIQMRNGILLRQRTKNKVIRFRNYRMKNNMEEYYRERLLLYVPWKKETDILGTFGSYKEAFTAKQDEVKEKIMVYEPMSSVLESVEDELEQEAHENEPIVAPSTQYENDLQGNDDPSASHELAFHEPDHTTTRHQLDISPLLGIAPVRMEHNDVDLIPNIMTDGKYYELLGQLNVKQEEFHTHIIHQATQDSAQILCALHGGAGTGKSTVTHAIYQGLYRLLNKHSGDDFSVPHALLVAPTGRAAYNIHGSTIHHAFMIAANQKLEHRALSFDNLNSLRNRFHGIKWILLDEFSMVGNTMLKLIHLRLQEAKGNQLPFGGVNIICVGDLYQLQPVMQSYIFMDISTEYGPLATNLWKEYFTIFELTEIMRQKDDAEWKQVLSRIRECNHTSADIELIMTRKISEEESLMMVDIPHVFPTRDGVTEFNEAVLQKMPGQITVVTAIDSPPTDISAAMQKLVLAAARNKDVNSTGSLPYQLLLKAGIMYDLTANVDVEDGMVNGAECCMRYVELNPTNDAFPNCIWVEFIDNAVGRKLRRTWNTQNNSRVKNIWTPVFSIRRSFTVRHGQTVVRTQFPLQIAAARTVHKSQSSTCPKLVVNFFTKKSPPKHFWDHLIYVGLSRVPSLTGLFVVNLNEEHISRSEKVKNYLLYERENLKLCYQPTYKIENSIKIIYNNVCSIAKKWKAIANNHNIQGCDIAILAETWLSPQNSNTYDIQNFKQIRMDSMIVPFHRGLLMYIKRDQKYSVVTMVQSLHLEICRCDIPYKDTVLTILGIYRPPSGNFTNFKEELFRHITACDVQSTKIIVGDFNINVNTDANNSFIQQMQQKFHLGQFIQEPTTFNGTTIDLVFSNLSSITAIALTNTWSFHHTLNICIPK